MSALTELFEIVKNNLTANRNKKLDLPIRSLKSVLYAKETLDAINASSLLISGTSLKLTPITGNRFEVTGGNLKPFVAPYNNRETTFPAVLHCIAKSDTEVWLFLVILPTTSWNLKDTFDLPGAENIQKQEYEPGFLTTFKLENQALILCGSKTKAWYNQDTHEIVTDEHQAEGHVELGFGLNFAARHKNLATDKGNSILKVIQLLYPNESPVLYGKIYNAEPNGQLYFTEYLKDKSISDFLKISNTKILYSSSVNNITEKINEYLYANSSARLYADIVIPANDPANDIKGKVIFDLPVGGTDILRINCQTLEINGLGVFDKLTGGEAAKLFRKLPAPFQKVISHKMFARNLEVGVKPGNKNPLTYVDCTVDFNIPNWTLFEINGFTFSTENPELGFSFKWEKGKLKEKSFGIGATFEIDPGNRPGDIMKIDTRIAYETDKMAVSGYLRSGEFDLAKVAKKIMPQAASFNFDTALTITDLSLEARFDSANNDKQISFNTVIKSGVQPFKDLPISLEAITIKVEYDSAVELPGSAYTFLLGAETKIGDTRLYVQAQKMSKGWSFQGQLMAGLNIKKVLKTLNKTFFLDETGILCPDILEEFTVNAASFQFNTDPANRNYEFLIQGRIKLDGTIFNIDLLISSHKTGPGDTQFEFKGSLEVGYRTFQFTLSKETQGGYVHSTLVATYRNELKDNFNIHDVVYSINSDIAELIPASFEISVKDAFFVYASTKPVAAMNRATPANKTMLFGIDIGVGIDLSDLPLVGEKVPNDVNMAIENLRLIMATNPVKTEAVDPNSPVMFINQALQANNVQPIPEEPNPDQAITANPAAAGTILGKGLNFACDIAIGSQSLNLVMAPKSSAQQANSISNDLTEIGKSQVSANAAIWIPIQKSAGPIHFDRIGFGLKGTELNFLLDASLTVGKLNISLEGLSVSTPINEFSPHFDLYGLGLNFKSSAIEIGGGLLKANPTPDNAEYAYDGFLQVRAKKLALTALGSYAKLKTGEPSFFAYVNVDYPLGGPPYFFVMGFAAGFGYNRNLKVPDIENISTFPLVQQALHGPPTKKGNQTDADYLMDQLKLIEQYVPPEVGQYFIAAGIKFTTFKIVNSFALLAFSFGRRMQINLFGNTYLIHPPVDSNQILGAGSGAESALSNIPYMAKISIDLLASYFPDDGIMEAKGAIKSGSYVYSPLAHIDGNFAFKSWLTGEHAGDFVFSLGGYHPEFKVPDHYPKRSWLKPLSLKYGISDHLYAKGSLYFALTPGALMVGGALEAVFDAGPFHASFGLHADFLVYFKPYHYDVKIGIDIHLSYTFDVAFVTKTVSLNAGADLHIWGPEFSGSARVHFLSFSKTISFGGGRNVPGSIPWSEFKESFLPIRDKLLSVNCSKGMLTNYQSAGGKEVWLVDPKAFVFELNSVIPIVTASYSAGDSPEDKRNASIGVNRTPVGIKPMRLDTGDFHSNLSVKIIKDGDTLDLDDFIYTPVLKNQTAALWGDYHKSSLTDHILPDVLSGFSIKPGKPPKSSKTLAVPASNLKYHTEIQESAFSWETDETFKKNSVQPNHEERITDLKELANDHSFLKGLVAEDILKGINLTNAEAEVNAFFIQPTYGTYVSA